MLLINDGTGFFTDETATRLRGPLGDYSAVGFGTSVEIHDIDNDGDQDIIKISTLVAVPPWGATGVFILFNDGTGHFNTVPFQSVAPTADTYMFGVADLNGDNKLDFFFQNDGNDRYQTALQVTPNGPNSYAPSVVVNSPRLSGFGGNVKIVDIDNDGDLDVGVAAVDTDIANCTGEAGTEFTLLRNDSVGPTILSDPYAGVTLGWHERAFDLAWLDVNRDGLIDLLLGNCIGYSLHLQVCRSDCQFSGVAGGSRYLKIVPPPGNEPVALRVTSPDHACLSQYVGADGALVGAPVFRLPVDWGSVLIHGPGVIPATQYRVFVELAGAGTPLGEVLISTDPFGEVDGIPGVSFSDISAVVQVFQGGSSEVTTAQADIAPCDPDGTVDFRDIQVDVDAFQGRPFANTCPLPCP